MANAIGALAMGAVQKANSGHPGMPMGMADVAAVGLALAERMAAARFPGLVDHFTDVIAGDGCLMEGISHEAADRTGHLGLGRQIVLWDDDKITIDGATALSTSTDQKAGFATYGWNVVGCDAHDVVSIAVAKADSGPSLIACRSVFGHGAPDKEGEHDVHGALL